jgi:hypothetical protein
MATTSQSQKPLAAAGIFGAVAAIATFAFASMAIRETWAVGTASTAVFVTVTLATLKAKRK